jgi:hypothetical protein
MIFNKSYAQLEYTGCSNASSTNWDNPSNNSAYNNNGNYTNNFNWFEKNANGYLINISTAYNYQMQPIYNVNYTDHYDYIRDVLVAGGSPDLSRIPLPDNGWELLALNIGKYPSGQTYESGLERPNVPFIILYNKYLEKIRLFATNKSSAPLEYNAIQITLSTNNASILRSINGEDSPISKDLWVEKSHAVAHPPSSPDQWFSVDFHVSFDPCVCDYPSNLQFDFNYIQYTDIEISGGGIEGTKTIVDAQNDLVVNDWLGNFNLNDNDDVQNGFFIYKDITSLFDNYIKELEDYELKLQEVNAHNDQVRKNRGYISLLKVAKTIATQGWGNLYTAISPALQTSISETFPAVVDLLPNDGDLKKYSDQVLKETKKLIGKRFDSYISENFSYKTPPKSPIQPTVSYSEYNFSGRLTQKTSPTKIFVHTPGSEDFTLSHPSNAPIFNEAMGVFALLNEPQVTVGVSSANLIREAAVFDTRVCWSSQGSKVWCDPKPHYLEYEKLYQFKLNELDYLINPSLKIQNKKVSYALVIDGTIANNTTTFFQNNPYTSEPNYLETYSEIYDFDGLNSRESRFRFESEFLELENMRSQIIQIPIQNAQNYDRYNYGDNPVTIGMKNINIELILLVEIEFEGNKADGSPNNYVYTKKYPVNEIVSNGQLFTTNIDGYNESTYYDLELNVPAYHCENVESFGGDYGYLCTAQNDIFVGGYFTDQTTAKLVAAGRRIIIKGGNPGVIPTIINQESRYTIKENDYTSLLTGTVREANKNDVDQVCSTKAGHYMVNRSNVVEGFVVENKYVDKIQTIEIFPNPASNYLKITSQIESSSYTINIYDLNGKLVFNKLIDQYSEISEHMVNIEKLVKGAYFVEITSGTYNETQKLIIN